MSAVCTIGADPSLAFWPTLANMRNRSASEHGPGPDVAALSDEALVRAIKLGGNPQHFRLLVTRHKTRVHHIALSVLGPGRQTDAEDVSQEVFIQLYRRLGSFRGDSRFSTWLYRMAFNQAIDHYRRGARHRTVPLDALPELPTPDSAERELCGDQTAQRIQAAVQNLPRAQAVMVHLYYWLGYKIREIAELLGCPENTVKVYLGRARKCLAETLDGQRDA